MTTMRILIPLGLLSALTTAGLGVMWLAPADAASTLRASFTGAAAADAACEMDGRGFRDVLESVRTKTQELARREDDVRAREASLAAMKTIVSNEVTRLERVATSLGVTGAPGAATSIARVYESMDAEDAAPILDRLDDSTLRIVLGRMRERQVAAILTAMRPERAVAITRALAMPGRVPEPSR
jgi:flagellar motility protein MotE (MotC chaperone)